MSGTSGFRCALCGGVARAPFRATQAPEIAPDLDMRPGEPVRSSLRDWLQACGSCGAAAPDLSVLPAVAKPVVQSAAYRALSQEAAEDILLFRRWAMICEAMGDRAAAAEALLQAAWAADDGADMVAAAKLRRDVAALWGDQPDPATALRLLDVLRRAGDFSAVEALGAALVADGGLDGFAASVVAFQRARAAARDIGRHLLTSAVPDHALPGDWPKPGFWAWLFRD
jgi:hypothetical protein